MKDILGLSTLIVKVGETIKAVMEKVVLFGERQTVLVGLVDAPRHRELFDLDVSAAKDQNADLVLADEFERKDRDEISEGLALRLHTKVVTGVVEEEDRSVRSKVIEEVVVVGRHEAIVHDHALIQRDVVNGEILFE